MDPFTWISPTTGARSCASRLLVERPIYDEIVEKLNVLAKAAVLGDPLDAKTQIGPIATKPEYDKILTYIESGKQSSARLTAGAPTPWRCRRTCGRA